MRCFKIVFLLSFVIQNFPMCAYDFATTWQLKFHSLYLNTKERLKAGQKVDL